MQYDKPKVIIDFDEYIELRLKAGLTTDSAPVIKADTLITIINEELSDNNISKEFNDRLLHLSYDRREIITTTYIQSSISMRDRILQLIKDNSKPK